MAGKRNAPVACPGSAGRESPGAGGSLAGLVRAGLAGLFTLGGVAALVLRMAGVDPAGCVLLAAGAAAAPALFLLADARR